MMLLDREGNLMGTNQADYDDELIDMDKLKKVLRKNPKLLEGALESLKMNPGGVITNSSSIKIN